MKDSLDYIYKKQEELSTIGGIAALLGWDQMTYMPPKGAAARSKQSSYVSRLAHEKIVSDKLWKHIQKLSKESNFKKLSEEDKIVVKKLRKDVKKARKVPSDFVEKMSVATTKGYEAWKKARKKNNFSTFEPHLKKIVELEREYCDYINIPGPKYNSLLDDYEEGMTVDKLKKEFDFLKKRLTIILDKIKDSQVYKGQRGLDEEFDIEKQKRICRKIISKLQLPEAKARLDESPHPFTTSLDHDDVRITTNFEHKNPLFSFFSTIHETGHALYELEMPQKKYKNTVVSDAASVGLHESQSRFWENMIGRNKIFWKHFFPFFKKMFHDKLRQIDLESWYKLVNQVKPGLIRVEADELTYNLHIILRFNLELDLINDNVDVSDLPEIWNRKMDNLLGVKPSKDREGVLQDMHWSQGHFGYFPTYTIGTIYASQLYSTLTEKKSSIRRDIENGDFKNIVSWLKDNIHNYGRTMTADEIIKNVCNSGLNAEEYIDYLKKKYFEVYEI
ncbi:MAG: carboxypeptidase M32 [Candidatus Thermoplasmatota archaeon]